LSLSKFDTERELLFCEETMSRDRLPKFMDFMTNVFENTETPMYGNISLTCLTRYL